MNNPKNTPSSWMNRRSAGILMHITSLPGPPYTGDIGPAAMAFVDFLAKSGQTVWQMLPLNPTIPEQSFSPYSASSAMAANPVLISIDWLIRNKLIDRKEIKTLTDNKNKKADFEKAFAYKDALLDKAFVRWKSEGGGQSSAFQIFCRQEAYWLQDYALFSVLKKSFKQSPWLEWPVTLRDRNPNALQKFGREHYDDIMKVKWTQMIFHEQWHELRSYCSEKGVKIMGDMPMYVAYDSCDVWSNRHLFTLNDDGSMSEVSGVPPDLFNDNGQLWGTPVFKWDQVKISGYSWWIDRFKRNFALFDILRLDHFRGFSAYWAVPAGARTAKVGEWKQGPGTGLFDAVKRSLGDLAIVAEDLGEIDEPVYRLRDELRFPGMNVLHFAFNDEHDNSYLPHHHVHNSIVYSGTHDNNTTKGWYRHLTAAGKKHLSNYTGSRVNVANVSDVLCRMAYQSVSQLVVLPMQDLLSLDAASRMNMPATVEGNWTWRASARDFSSAVIAKLKKWVILYGRSPE